MRALVFMWKGRFSQPTRERVQRYGESVSFDWRLYAHDIRGSIAHARGLEKADPRLTAKARDRWFAPDPNNAKQLEEKREKALLKEFEIYKAFTGRKIKESRLEVLRAGFRTAWANKDNKTIISVANKLPEETLQEDEKLLLWYDQALTRTEAGA